MAFVEYRFPTNISMGSRGGPGFSTSIVEGEGGSSERVSRWASSRRMYNAKYGIRTFDNLSTVLDFYIARQGPAIGFRWKDHLDFTTASNHRNAHTANDVVIGTGTGSLTTFQLLTKYVSGPTTVTRVIQKPVAGTVLIALNGTPTTSFTVDTTTGIVTMNTAPSGGVTVTCGCEFDVPVQFGGEIDEQIAVSIENFDSGDIPDIPIVEMVSNVASPERFYYGDGTVVTAAASFNVTHSFRTWVYAPSSTGTTFNAFLPNPADLELGGPYFYIYDANPGAGQLVLKTYDNLSTIGTITSIGKAAIMVVYNDGTTNKWLALIS